MIFLTPAQLKEVEYLISQSKSGIHHLFGPEDIRLAFSSACQIESEQVDSVKELFYTFISQETIELKRHFYQKLDTKSRALIVRTYFNVVQNELVATQSFLI
jgi:hypothetical protein